MGILDNFERGLERAVNGAFARTFKSNLQPIEITAALRKELDTRAAVVSRDRVLAPNRFAVRLSGEDFERMSAMGPSLTDELTRLVQQHAQSQGYQFAGGVSIGLDRDDSLAPGLVQVDSATTKGDVSWTPVIEVAGTRYPLKRGRTVIGRGSDADITITDSGTSRRHVEILWDGSRAQVNDLGSTNGTTLNGERVDKALLPPDSVVQIGRTRIVFRVVPRSSDGQHEEPGVRGGR
ncbi:DUF3662 and FHA domain-containing protein [Naasia sp. SYSU D00948]|uniref:FhaA domain-containing protein n=1 Tax=Naasia sp. SYSU D00948 TaxID=2817379 RepID=UPI001B30675C|nr:DUF3662 and FHA domain-containing protein [Naasia sp. SYSU D00948]